MDNPPQIVVNPSALPALGGVIVRYASALAAGWLIRRGVITDSDTALVEGLAIALATAGYALWRAWQQKQKMIALAHAAPDHIAVVGTAPLVTPEP